MSRIRVFLVDDHRLFRNGLLLLLGTEPDILVVGEAANGEEFLDELEKASPDVVLMDIEMPVMDGITATEAAVMKFPGLKVLTLSMYGDENYFYRMIDAGAKGFILKDSDIEEVTKAIRAVHSGATYFNQDILYQVVKNIREVRKETVHPITLSPRESEVIKAICQGLSNHEIATKLNISRRTVEKHRASLLIKTQTKNAASLVMFAIENNLIEPSCD